MRKTIFSPEEYYHIYNRGNNKKIIFLDVRDYTRFIIIILLFQSPVLIHNISKKVTHFIKYKELNILKNKIEEIIKDRSVDLINFTLMPNHFHLTLYEREEGGISRYMQRIQDAYAKYFNIKYKQSGHLLQGPFKAVHIKDNKQLLYLSSYIHRNQRELKEWKDKEHKYPWSSYRDYILDNRWDNLLKPGIILEQYNSLEEYKKFVKTSIAKEKNILDKILF